MKPSEPAADQGEHPILDADYLQLTGASQNALFSSPAWLRVIARTYGIAFEVARAGSVLVPYALISEHPRRVVALPFSDVVQPLGGRLSAPRLVTAMEELGLAWRARLLARDVDDLPDGTLGPDHRWSAIEVNDDLGASWAALRPAGRRKVTAARRDDVRVRRGSTGEDLRCFFEMHLRLRKNKFRMLAQPFRFFREIWDEFGAADRCVLLLAEKDGMAVAATMLVKADDTLYYKFNASTAEGGQLGANYLILWQAIELAHASGIQRIDLGLTPDGQAGLWQFKRTFSSIESAIVTLASDSSGPGVGADVLNALVDLATAPSTPDIITEAAGDGLYRLFV